jgi:ATP-dependent DNA helicase RecG
MAYVVVAPAICRVAPEESTVHLAELLHRIQHGENLHTEFKTWPLHPDDMAAAMIAFANTDGGNVFLGVDDSGQVVGLAEQDVDRAAQFVDNVAFNNCAPPVTIVQETLLTEQARVVLVVQIPKGDQRPYRTNRGIYYVRTTSGRRQASREELLRLFQATESLYYDETPIVRSGIADLDERALANLLEDIKAYGFDIAGIPRERLLHNWRLLRPVDAEDHLTVAGLLFLAREPQHFLSQAYISALRIPGTDIAGEPRDQKRLDGRLPEMLRDALRFLDIHLPRRHRIHAMEPEAKTEIPVEVLRESLVNAWAHRDYTLSAPVRVLVFDDRVEVRTPGQLPNSVTLDALRFGVHVLRNPTIYNMLLKIGLVTDAGSGIPRMIRLLRQTTGAEPVFCLQGPEFVVILPRPQAG